MKNATTLVVLAAAAIFGSAASIAADVPSAKPQSNTSENMARAREAIKNKDWQKSIVELSSVVKVDSRNADAHSLLGYSYRKQSTPDLPLAFEHYNTALKLNPKHKGAHEYIGEAYLTDKKPAEAEKHLGELEKICGNKTCEEYGDLAKAIADYRAKN